MEISVLFDYVTRVKPARHRSVDGVFRCSLLTRRAAEDTGALSRRFLRLSSLREGKSICQGDLLSERTAFVKLASLGTALVQTQNLFLVEKECRPMLWASWIPGRSLRLLGTLGAPRRQLYCIFPSFPVQRWLGAPAPWLPLRSRGVQEGWVSPGEEAANK